jgi:mRNA interferase HigB
MHLISMKAILDAVIQFPQHREELFLGRTIEKSHCPTPVALRKNLSNAR